MPDIRSFFGGGGGGGGKQPTASKPAAASPPAPAKRKQSTSSKASGQDNPSSSSSSSRTRSKKADDEGEADERKEAPKKAGKVKVTDGKAGEKRAAAAAAAAGSRNKSTKRSSYYEHFDDDDDGDDAMFVPYQRTAASKRAASKAKHSKSNGDDEEEEEGDEEWQDESAATPSKRAAGKPGSKSPAAKPSSRKRNSRAADEDDADFIVDAEEGEEQEQNDMYDEDEQPGLKKRKRGGADSNKKKRRNVLVDEDEQQAEEADGEEGKEEVKADEGSRITKHFGSATSQKQRLREEKEKDDKKKAEDAKKRAEQEAKAAVEKEKERKAQALKDKRRMGVVDEETAMKELEGGKPDTSVPANARSQRTSVRKAEIDPAEFFSNPAAAKAKLSAKDRAHPAQKPDVVDVDDMEDDVPLETADSLKQKAADKQRKQEQDSLLLARKLQQEEDDRALRPPPSSTAAASPKRGAAGNGKKATPTKRVKREDDDDEPYEEEASSAKRRKTSTPVKQPGKKEEKEVKKEVKKEEKKAAPTASKADKAAAEENEDPYAEAKPEKKKWNPYLARQAMDSRPATLGLVKEVPEGAEGCLLGLAFVISGVLDSLDRDAAQTLIERYGGRITGSVSGKTNFLLMGSDAGESKKKKAEQLKTTIIDEDGLFELIRSRKGHSLSADQALKAKAAAAKTTKAASAAQQSAQGVTASIDTTTSQGQEQLRVHGKVAERAEDMLWVDKHRPLKLSEIIGNPGLVKQLGDFLVNWDAVHLHEGKADKDSPKAVLISGAPGLGKSTSASLVAREKGFNVVEFNASDVRNKASLEGIVGQLISNRGLDEYYNSRGAVSSASSSSSKASAGKKTVLIMDEVDGIAGSQDRGGLQQLVTLIKRSRLPIICIANDVSQPKMKTLKSYTRHIIWRRPTTDQIVPRLTAIATAEGLSVDVNAMRKLIESTQADIRQCINYLQMYSKTHKKLTFDSVVKTSDAGGGKDFDVGVFEVVPSFFRDPGRKQGWIDARSDLYFEDSGLVPLFVQDLYLKAKPRLAAGVVRRQNVSAEKAGKLLECDAMDVVSQAADYIAGADMMNGIIYQEQDYAFMPVHAVLSSVAPGYLMSAGGVQGGMAFPSWLGKNSTRLKRGRLIREMKMAMSLTSPASFTDYITDYLPVLRIELVEPLMQQQHSSDDAVTTVCDTLDQLGLVKDDWDMLVEVTDDLVPPKDKLVLDTAVKRRFTSEWKKGAHKLRVRRGELKAERGVGAAGGLRVGSDELEDEEGAEAGEEEGAEEDAEGTKEGKESEDVKKDPMIAEAKIGSASKDKGKGKGGASRGGKGGRGRGGKGGKAASKGGRGKKASGGSGKKKGGKEERSDDDDDDGDDMADFIVSDDDDE